MNTINMPGFTAEASLSRAREHYHILVSSVAEVAGEVILQQLQQQWDFCHTDMQGRITQCCTCYSGICLCQPAKKKTFNLLSPTGD